MRALGLNLRSFGFAAAFFGAWSLLGDKTNLAALEFLAVYERLLLSLVEGFARFLHPVLLLIVPHPERYEATQEPLDGVVACPDS